jgi:uncharacterized protein (DUF2147 family)
MVFDGVDDYVQLVNSSSYKVQFPITLSVWFNSQTLSNYGVLIRNDNTSDSHWGFVLNIGSDYTLGASYGNGTANAAPARRSYSSSVVINRNQWRGVTNAYKTFGASIEMKLKGSNWEQVDKYRSMTFKQKSLSRLSAGLSFYNDKAGDGNMGITQVNLSLATFVPLNNKNSIF